MPYDPELDEKKFDEKVEMEGTNVTIGVFSYNDGERKLQLGRERVNAEGKTSFAKLGRLTKEEAEKVIPIMQKALEKM